MPQNKIYFYNTLGKKLEEFKPLKSGEVSIYSCGPTVYSYQHIGNLRSYIFADILKRTLIFNGYQINHVINITDVGHLTSDADEGEDKIEKAAKTEKKTAKEIADYYFDIFEKDLEKLNIAKPNKWPKASEHIKEQIKLIEKLAEKGFTYKTADGIYFDTSKFPDYGKLSGQNLQEIKAGSRIDLRDKKNPTDFALWKFSEKPGKRQQEWKSPWGIGFPGWHLECSAMSMKYLGETIDIHTGGEDHVNIHHTNEIAQSEGATGKKFVNYWLHGAFLTFNGEKISKSKGGLYTLNELEKLGYKPMHFRYLVLGTHYRKQLDFSLESLDAAKNAYERMVNIVSEIPAQGGSASSENEKYLNEFREKTNDDLDMPGALAILWNLLRDEKAEGKIQAITKMDEVLGLELLKKEIVEIPKQVKKLIEERGQARENKNWELSDELRDKISKLGYSVEDKIDGPKIKKIE